MKKFKVPKNETKFERDLRKACGLNSGLRVRDYYGVHVAVDMADHLKDFSQYLDVKTGDTIFLVSFKWKSKAHHARARKFAEKMFKKYIQK